MPQEVAVRVVNARELRAALKRAGDDLDEMKDSHARVSAFVADEAEARAPRRSGRLAASVRGSRQVRRARVSAGGAAVPWAGPIHWGWPDRNIEAQPFIADAAHDTEPRWLPTYLEEVEAIVDRVHRTVR